MSDRFSAAAKAHAESEGDNGNAEISFTQGAEYGASDERKRFIELFKKEADYLGLSPERVKYQLSIVIRILQEK